MRKTYITRMPDTAGAFLLASRIVSEVGGNIVRVNYNRAVDVHTLFLEVDADDEQQQRIESGLAECGYLSGEADERRILMIALTLPDVAGAVRPALEVISRSRVNISYISAQENGSGFQDFKMGLLIDNSDEVSQLIHDISRICRIRILDYTVTDRLLDSTVFYITFADEMRTILQLDQAQTNDVLISANRLMQLLDEQKQPVLQTFDYIRRFAQFVRSREGDNFRANITELHPAEELTLWIVEPPCGSNVSILRYRDELLVVDSGFACYREELLRVFRERIPDFYTLPKRALITHADVDHAGLLDIFDEVYMPQSCYDNFELERRGEPNFREQNPLHEPYCRLSKVISEYAPPPAERCRVVGEKKDDALFTDIGGVGFGPWEFRFHEGPGGHIRGESAIVCEELKLVFSGDIFVNIRGFSREQSEFNRLAPFLMTGVDSDGALCRAAREYLLDKYKGYTFCGGHGATYVNERT